MKNKINFLKIILIYFQVILHKKNTMYYRRVACKDLGAGSPMMKILSDPCTSTPLF
jgi:hypothetical protein